MSPNRQRLAFTFKGTDLSSTGGQTFCLSRRDANKCEYDCSLFYNKLLLERLGIRVMKGQLDIWPLEEHCHLIFYQEPFWILFKYVFAYRSF